jgi:tetratricopeptide (TPR) repeat protein
MGLIAVVARHLPEAHKQVVSGQGKKSGNGKERFWLILQGRLRGAWRFILEAKGLRDPAGSRFRMKQLLEQNKRSIRPKSSAAKIQAARVEAEAVASVENSPMAEAVQEVTQQPAPVRPVVAEGPRVTVREPSLQLEDAMTVAKKYLDNKQYFEARKLLESLGSEPHASPVYWARLGYAQYHLGAYGEAIRCYEKSLSLDSNQPNRYYNLALAYEAAGNRVKSLSHLDKALRLDPANQKYNQTKQALVA